MTCHNHNTCQKTAFQHAEKVCEEIGARFTEGRKQVLQILWQSHKAMSAADVMAQMENPQPPITYRALEFLTKAGLIHHITSLNAYIGCAHNDKCQNNSELLICTTCNTVDEVQVDKIIDELNTTATSTGFMPQRTLIEVLGTCKTCNASS